MQTSEDVAKLREQVTYNIARKANYRLLDLSILMDAIHEELSSIIDTDCIYVAMLDEKGSEISFPYFQFNQSNVPDKQAIFQNQPIGNGLIYKLINDRKPIQLGREDLMKLADEFRWLSPQTPTAWLGYPMLTEGVAVGVFVVMSFKDETVLSPENVDFLTFVARQVQAFIERTQITLKLIKSREELYFRHKEALNYQSMLLSSRLNPHFIFNALNSIQNHVLSADRESALMFISNFATLMRAVLDNSANTYIPLSKEIAFLKMYLDLECQRYNNKFTYHFEFPDDLEPEDVFIPPMLLQPFIENTVVHGVGPLEKDGQITVSFETKSNQLLCTIADNGVGREKAAKLKILRSGSSESSSTSIINSRLDILNELSENAYFSATEDLFDKTGKAAGTLVKINIPMISENDL